MADYGYGAEDDSGVDYGTDDDFGPGRVGYGHNLTGIDDPIDTNIDYGYSTVINGVTYTKDKDGKWTYEDSGGNIQPISQAAVDKLTNTANQASNSIFQSKLKDPSFVKKINDALGTKFSAADLLKIGAAGIGGIAGAMGAGTATTKPTGYQGGIPDLVATQPMLTEPPPGRRPGSGGINYGTGVQYKDSKGNIVSDTSTSVADLYKKATEQGTFNQWGNTYGNTVTPVAPTPFTFTPAPPRTSSAPPPPPPPPPQPTSGYTGNTNPTPSNGIATGIDPSHPWSKASSDPKIRAIQNELEKLSQTKGTPEQRQAVLDQFLHSTKYTPAQLSAASNGMWGVQDLIDQMQGNSNVFNAQTPWSVYSTKADIKGVQDALQQLSQTPGDDKTRQAALQNFLKTTKYTPAQLAAASNGMWKISDLETQMAGNPVLTDLNKGKTNPEAAPSSQAGSSNAPAGGFVTGGGGAGGEYGSFGSKEAYDKAVADETARRNAEKAELDKYHVSPDSLYYSAYMAATGQRKEDIKKDAKELAERIARRTAISQMGYGEGFISNGSLMGPNGPIYPNENEVGVTVTDASGRNRYQTKAEAAEIERKTQQYLMDHGNIIDPNKPFNVASTDAGTQSVQAALAKLSQTPGDDKTRQAALQNFLKTTTFTPEQLAAASNGVWGVNDLKTQMAGNTNQPNTRTGYDDPNQAQIYQEQNGPSGGDIRSDAGLAALAGQISTPMTGVSTAGIPKTGIQELDPNSIYQNPGSRSLTREDEDQMKIFDDMRNGKSPTLDPKDLYQNPGDPGQQTLPYQYRPHPGPDSEYPPEYRQPIGDPGPPDEMSGGLAALATQAEQPKFNGGYPVEDYSNNGDQNSNTITASIDQYNPNDYFYSGGAKKGGLIKRHAEGGLTNLDHGGFVIPADVVSHFGNGSSSAGLELLAQKMGAKPIKGQGDGMSDSIPAAIDGREKALVANDEAYLSPQMVERLGDGDMDAGSRKLKNMMEQIRKARTGNKEQGKQINPNNFMPGGTVGYAQGGGIKSYAGTDPTGSLVTAGVTGTEQNLSNYIGPYVSNMLGKTQALANTPYQAYTGPLTAGASGLQNLAFQNAGNLSTPSSVGYAGNQMAQIGDQAQKSSYDPATFGNQFQAPTPYQNTNFTAGTFDSGAAQQYMNPYLQASLDPQLAEARRQSEITQQQNNAAMTKAGAFGGGRQAILTSENQRNLGTNQANITGQGYNTAYTNAMSQFNQDQARNLQAQQMAEQSKQFGAGQGMTAAQLAAQYGLAGQQAGEASRQFGANYGMQGLNTALQSAQGLGNLGIASGGLSLQNLNTQAALGATQRGIESEGIAADKAQFEEARKDPYTKLQFQQSMLNGLPITATNYTMSQPSAFQGAAGGANTLVQFLKNLGIGTEQKTP